MSLEYPTNGERIMSVTDAIEAVQKDLEERLREVTPLWHKIPTLEFPDEFERWTLKVEKPLLDLIQLMIEQNIALHKKGE